LQSGQFIVTYYNTVQSTLSSTSKKIFRKLPKGLDKNENGCYDKDNIIENHWK